MLNIRSDYGLIAVVGLVLATIVMAENENCTDFQQSNGPIITPCQSEIVLEKGQNVSILCKGKTRLEFKQQEISVESTTSFLMEQRIMNESSDVDYPYETVLDLYNIDEYAIGYYACFDDTVSKLEVLRDLIEEPKNTAHISYIYVYVNGTDSFFAPMTELILPKGNLFMIECRPTTPDIEVSLIVSQSDRPADYLMFSKKIGYIMTKCKSVYKCIGHRGNQTAQAKSIRNIKPPPEPVVTNGSKYFLRGESFVLNCTVHFEKQVVNLYWNYTQNVPNDTIVLESNEYDKSILYSRLLYRSLTVLNATKEHEGNYTCYSVNSCGKKSAGATMTYLAEPFINLSQPNDGAAKDGLIVTTQRSIHINVNIEAYPAVEYYILRDGKNLTIDGIKYTITIRRTSTLNIDFCITNTTVEDSGNYTFVAYNKYLKKNVTAFYRKKAVPKITFGKDKKCVENTTVTFECKVTGYKRPTVSWLFSNSQGEVEMDPTELIIDSIYQVTARLTIPVRSSANVTCKAENDLNNSQRFETRGLYLYEVPGGFGVKDEEDLWFWETQNIRVKCYASIYDYESVTWLDPEGELQSMVHYTNSSYSYIAELTINHITLEHAGNYTCRALTKNGIQHDHLVLISVTELHSTTIQIPKSNRNVEVYKTQENICLHCQADGVPPPQIRWEKDGVVLSNNSDVYIFTQKISRTVVNSTLTIRKMKDEIKGKYECVSFSDTEQSRRAYMLSIQDQHAYMNYLIGIIFITIFLILLVAYLTWKIKKMKQFKRELAAAGLLYFEEGATKSLNPDLAIDEQAELLPYDKKFEFPQEKLHLGKQLGAGAFGVVYKAEARGIINAEVTTTVAVKMVKKNAETMFIKALASELKIMVHLGKHVNIVNLLGACTKNVGKRELIVIVEYCKFGNIHNYMQRHRDVFIDQLSDNKDKNLGKVNRAFSCSSGGSTGGHSDYFGSANTQDTDHTFLNTANTNRSVRKVSEGYVQPEWRSNYESDYSFDGRSPRPLTSRDLLAWAFQIARGMEYLASRKILHGDLAARNVLLADDNIVKICDFGLAKSIYKNDEYQKKENSPLPIKWLAIESMTDRIFSTQSDVWSFGVVLWELFSLAKTPYPNISPTSLVQWLNDGNRLDKPPYADDRLYGVMRRCWEQKPTARPSFSELQEILGTFLEDNVRNHYVDLNSAYMDMNVKSGDQQDYLEMVCAPDYNNLVTPSPHHYVNARSFFPTTPTKLDEEGYLQMNASPQRIFSPRPAGTTFDFEARKFGSRVSEASSGSELTPMLALNRLPTRSGSESDQECLESNSHVTNGCPRIDEESDDVFEKRNNEKNIQPAAVTNPTYITFDLDLDKKPKDIINNYVNIPVPNGMVE